MYAAADSLAERLGNAFAAIYRSDPARATDDLMAASAEIDGYLAARYAVPVSAPEAQSLLSDWCLTLTEERAYARAGGSTIPEKIRTRVDAVRRNLRDAATGMLRLPASPPETDGGIGGILIVEADEPVFGRTRMEGY